MNPIYDVIVEFLVFFIALSRTTPNDHRSHTAHNTHATLIDTRASNSLMGQRFIQTFQLQIREVICM